jgi:hypothetical protein
MSTERFECFFFEYFYSIPWYSYVPHTNTHTQRHTDTLTNMYVVCICVCMCESVYTERKRELPRSLFLSLSRPRALSLARKNLVGAERIQLHLLSSECLFLWVLCVCVCVCVFVSHTHVHTHGHIRRGMQACVVRIKKQMTGGMLSTSAKCTPVFWVGSLKRFLVIALRCRQLEHA